jgi:hypothetical protein
MPGVEIGGGTVDAEHDEVGATDAERIGVGATDAERLSPRRESGKAM